jgi:two-component system NtrC family sensor kinase
VIAVQSREDGRAWTLRATLNSERFASLVRTEDMGRTFDAYIVNSAGVYQTPPRQGEVLERSPIRDPRRHTGVSLERRDDANGRAILLTTTWLNDGRWQLVVQQDEAEVRAPLRQALGLGAIVMALAVIVVALATVLATRHLVGLVEVADGARDALARDLMRSAQLASVGEMATGLAHEINNPLAVIGAEQTNLGDLVGDLPESAANRAEMLDSIARCRRQVQRCGAITAKMLQFGRQGESRPRVVAAAERLREIASTVERQTAVSGVALAVDLAPDLPAILVDPVELEQVVVNLVNNALHATPRGGRIDIAAARDDAVVVIRVADTGAGIERANLDKVFQPFFTTKPVGKGTGLGLSVCHGLVRGWGGTLGIESEVGAGTVVTFTVPVAKEARQEPGR